MTTFKTEVLAKDLLAEHIVGLRLKKPEGFSWSTGEFALVGLPLDGDDVFRCYSMASLPEEDALQFFISVVPNGQLSPRIHDLQVGQTVLLDSESAGALTLEKTKAGGKTLWLFATGTGVSPFIAHCNDPRTRDHFEHIVLVHGVNTWEETQYVSRYLKPSPTVHFLCSVNREPKAALRKFLNAALIEGDIERLVGLTLEPKNSRVMLCGNPFMIEAMTKALGQRGLHPATPSHPGEILIEGLS